MLEKTLESPLACKEIKLINPKGNQSWIFIGRTDAKVLILWSPNGKSWLIRKDPDAGTDCRPEEKGTTEDKMVGWHHWLNGHEFKQAPGVSDGQGSLVCCSPWGHKESDMTERLNWAEQRWCGHSPQNPGVKWALGSITTKLVEVMKLVFSSVHLLSHVWLFVGLQHASPPCP